MDSASRAAGESRPSDIPALTGLRMIAALAVVAYHLRGLTAHIVPPSGADVVTPLLEGGVLGVDVFFVLSGFVIAHTYAHRLAAPAPGAREYLIARLARVYPLHLTTFLVMVVLLGVGSLQGLDIDRSDNTLFGFVGNLLMLQALPEVPAWNLPAWSICCELAAYVVFPLFAARLVRVRWGSALLLAGVALGLQLVVMSKLSGTVFELYSLMWPRIAGEFTAGALLWVVWHRVLRPGLWGDAVVVLCALGSACLLLFGNLWFGVPLLAVTVPAIACATGPVARLLAHPAMRWGGRISYALYLVHIPVLTLLLVWFVPDGVFARPTAGSAAVVLGTFVVAAVAAAALLHHGVEEPARRWVRRRFVRATTTGPTAPADERTEHGADRVADQLEGAPVNRATIAR